MPRADDGTYSVPDVVKWLRERERLQAEDSLRKQTGSERGRDREGAAAPTELQDAQTRYRVAAAERAEMALARERGELIERDQVVDLFTRRVVELRGGLLRVPRRVSNRFDPEIRRRLFGILDGEVRALLEQYSRPAEMLRPKGGRRK